MRKISFLALIFGIFLITSTFIVIVPVSVLGDDVIAVPHGFWTGNNWRDSSDAERLGYAMGVIDGILFASAWERGECRPSGASLAWVKPCIVGMRNDQVRAIIQRELDKHPEVWHEDMHPIVYRALYNTCPSSPKFRK